ncbi:MAG: hypothetical protein EPO40_27175 [Myxococcaceae bacterium]|nr:MAG: hypothetical protein EPO40_27175 [Myxococcaceae bacterium]
MSRPRFLGLLGERPVFRFDSAHDLLRVWPKAVQSHPGPFAPGLYMVLPGTVIRIPDGFGAQLGADRVRAACSTPRLARSLSVAPRASGPTRHPVA